MNSLYSSGVNPISLRAVRKNSPVSSPDTQNPLSNDVSMSD